MLRAGADSEMVSAVNLDQVKVIGDAPEVAFVGVELRPERRQIGGLV